MLDRISYTDTFFNELNPHAIRCIAAMRGFDIPDSHSFTYCELGCGTGHSLIVFAAANPQAQFIGIDFNEEHIAHAKHRADSLGILNCTFLHADITALQELPSCDYIVMHGLYTWVHQSVRDAIHHIIERSLSHHGLVLVSYNAYPGWHLYEPLRMMFREYSMGLSEDPFANAEQGIGFLRWMQDQHAEYMNAIPSSASFIEELTKHDRRYIIHEYYADHWTPLWFKDMDEHMSRSGLSFAGQIPMYLNNGSIALSEEFHEILSIEGDIKRFETFKDLIRNTMFRWDIYAKKSSEQSTFESMHIGIVQTNLDFSEQVQLPNCKPIALDMEFHAPIIKAMMDQASTLNEIIEYCTALDLTRPHVESAIHNLLMTEQIKPIPGNISAIESITQFKQYVLGFLEEALIAEEHVIPSIFSGSGIYINKDTALMLLACIKHADDPIQWITEWMEVHGYGNYSDVYDKAKRAYQEFEQTIPFWQRMQIM